MILLKHIDYIRSEKGSTFILVLMTFLPVLILITYFGFQFRNVSTALLESRNDTQIYYIAEMGIERYKNLVIANPTYSAPLSFSKVIEGETYDIDVVSLRIGSGANEKIKITSTVDGTDISAERTILLSRF